MAEPSAVIRAYAHSEDEKLVRFKVGKSQMEPLAVANRRASTHPLSLALWALLSAVFIQLTGWWSNEANGWWSYLSPLPALAASAVPIMFLIDWLNRPYFDEETQKVLGMLDFVDLQSYYARSPASGLWLLEYGPKFVGLIAMDASIDALSEGEVKNIKPRIGRKGFSKGTSEVACIRHLYVEESYRPALMQKDLLKFAVDHTFTVGENVKKIVAKASPLSPYFVSALRDAGFKVVERGDKMGVLGWKIAKYELTRQQWAANRKS